MIIANPLVQKMVNRLQRAIVDDEMRHKMDVEDEIEQILERENSQSAAEIAAQKVVIKEMSQTIAAKDQTIAAKDQAIADERQKVEAERQIIVNNLILNTDLSDAQISSITTFALDFVVKCRDTLKAGQ
jgi:protein tyrosine/serine phosphatase